MYLDAIGCSHCCDQKDSVETFDRVSVNIRDTMSTRELERFFPLFLSLSLSLSPPVFLQIWNVILRKVLFLTTELKYAQSLCINTPLCVCKAPRYVITSNASFLKGLRGLVARDERERERGGGEGGQGTARLCVIPQTTEATDLLVARASERAGRMIIRSRLFVVTRNPARRYASSILYSSPCLPSFVVWRCARVRVIEASPTAYGADRGKEREGGRRTDRVPPGRRVTGTFPWRLR